MRRHRANIFGVPRFGLLFGYKSNSNKVIQQSSIFQYSRAKMLVMLEIQTKKAGTANRITVFPAKVAYINSLANQEKHHC